MYSPHQQEKKKRRNVVFKKQRYFSVYEYPKEHLDVSPSRSEPKLDWNVASNKSNYFDVDRIGYQELREEFNGRFSSFCYGFKFEVLYF